MYDSIIIGGGPAALSAAIYLIRYELKVLLLTDSFGGQTAIAGTIENYPGFIEINGGSLIQKMQEQASALNVEMKSGNRVTGITKEGDNFKVNTEGESFSSKTVLIATGKRSRKLGIENEDNLIGKGISYCATCDGPFARGKDIVVAGGGYAALEAVLVLSKIAKSIKVINIAENLGCDKRLVEKVSNLENVEVLNNSKIIKLKETDGYLSEVMIENSNDNRDQTFDAKMLFIEVGQIPNSDSFKDIVRTNDINEIVIDHQTNQTSCEGIYAAGDITDIYYKQTIIAASEGAKAAMSINKHLEKIT